MPESRNFTVPGDISSAAFWLAAAAAQPGARLLVKKIGLNDTRTGVLSVLLRMGAHVHEVIEDIEQIEPTGTVEVQGARLHGTVIEGREIPNVIDEIPILAVLGALASGQTVIRNAAELRVKETDRLRALAINLKAMGAQVEEYRDGLVDHRRPAAARRAAAQLRRPPHRHGVCHRGAVRRGRDDHRGLRVHRDVVSRLRRRRWTRSSPSTNGRRADHAGHLRRAPVSAAGWERRPPPPRRTRRARVTRSSSAQDF